MNDSAILTAIRHNPLLSGLGDAEHAVLISVGTITRFSAGTVLYERGEAAHHLFVVVEGTVALYVPDEPGVAVPLYPLSPGDSAGEESLAPESCYDMAARAMTEAVVFSIESRRLARILDQRFDLVLGMLVGMSTRLRGLVREITALKMASTAERLGTFLLELADAHQPSQHGAHHGAHLRSPVTVTLPFSKQMLAQKLGMQPESLSRAFGKLRQFGVRGSGQTRVVLNDLSGLRDFCQPESFL
jgi:CRP-like cAMP-binding protein